MDCKRSRNQESPATAEVIDDDDLLTEILLFIPAKPLITFKSVCKRWNHIISGDRFRRLHTLRLRGAVTHPQLFILRANRESFFYFNPKNQIFRPYKFPCPRIRILHSCQGLQLIAIKKSLYGQKHYCVYNPITFESRTILKDGSWQSKRELLSGLCLAFDPEKSPHYKVVCIRRPQRSSSVHSVVVYHSETHSWDRVGRSFHATADANFYDGIFLNNKMYWIKRTNAKSYCLDLETGIVKTLPRNSAHTRRNEGSKKNYIMESNGHLHYISLYLRRRGAVLRVSEFMQSDLVWSERYNVNLTSVSALFQELTASEISVLCVVRGDDEEDYAVYFLVPGKIIAYRLCDGDLRGSFCLETKEFYRHGRLEYHRKHAYQFVESLVPV